MLLRRHDAEMLVSNEQIFDLSHRLFLRVRVSQTQVPPSCLRIGLLGIRWEMSSRRRFTPPAQSL